MSSNDFRPVKRKESIYGSLSLINEAVHALMPRIICLLVAPVSPRPGHAYLRAIDETNAAIEWSTTASDGISVELGTRLH